MRDLSNATLLGDIDLDRFGSVLANLLQEVVALSERVAELEGGAEAEAIQGRVDEIIERVLAPLA